MLARGPLKAPTGKHCHVFISHAGEQKHDFVDFVKKGFEDHYPGDVKAFLDEYDLQPGDDAMERMHAHLGDAFVVVIMLSKEFISKKYPMEELQLLLERYERHKQRSEAQPAWLMPAFYGIAWGDVDKQAKLYKSPTEEMVALTDHATQLLWPQWARDLDTLKRITGFRKDQVASGYGPAVVEKICHQAVQRLAGMGQLVQSKMQPMPAALVQDAWREDMVRGLVSAADGAHPCHKVLLTGISGIGKTTLAKAVFNRLHKANPTMPCLFWTFKDGTSVDRLRREMLQGLAFVDGASKVSDEALPARLAHELSGKRVLLVLDNVRGSAQLWVLDKVIDVLGPGSMVLVTGIIMEPPAWFSKAFVALEVEYLSEESSLELLCKHVVGDSDGSPAAGGDLLKRACDCIDRHNGKAMLDTLLARCGRLPMALEVVGQYLRSKQPRWQFFKNLEKNLEHVYELTGSEGREDHLALFPALRFSWDVLKSSHKHTLLDIVWCLKGQGRQLVSSHCSDLELGVLECDGFVIKGGSAVNVPAVMSDFCKMDDGSKGMGRHAELYLVGQRQHSAKKRTAGSQLAQVGDSLSLWLDGHELTGTVSDALSTSTEVAWTALPVRVLRVECAVQPDKVLQLALPHLRWHWVDTATTWDRLHLEATNISVILLQNLGQLEAVDGLESCEMLKAVRIFNCCSLELVTLGKLPNLDYLEVSGCTKLAQLEVSGCTKLARVEVGGCSCLSRLEVADCEELQEVELTGLAALRQLRLEASMQDALGGPRALEFSGCTSLQEMALKDCPELETITGLGCSLTRLQVSGLKGLPDLSLLSRLQELEMIGFAVPTSLVYPPSLTSLVVDGVETLQQPPLQAPLARELEAEGCASLSHVHDLVAGSSSHTPSPSYGGARLYHGALRVPLLSTVRALCTAIGVAGVAGWRRS